MSEEMAEAEVRFEQRLAMMAQEADLRAAEEEAARNALALEAAKRSQGGKVEVVVDEAAQKAAKLAQEQVRRLEQEIAAARQVLREAVPEEEVMSRGWDPASGVPLPMHVEALAQRLADSLATADMEAERAASDRASIERELRSLHKRLENMQEGKRMALENAARWEAEAKRLATEIANCQAALREALSAVEKEMGDKRALTDQIRDIVDKCTLLPAACCLLPAACCLLPAACRLPPAACCLLPAACRLPPAHAVALHIHTCPVPLASRPCIGSQCRAIAPRAARCKQPARSTRR